MPIILVVFLGKVENVEEKERGDRVWASSPSPWSAHIVQGEQAQDIVAGVKEKEGKEKYWAWSFQQSDCV